jgi:5'(3')-deoxyribonucleotidase
MVDLDDVLWNLVEHWIDMYKHHRAMSFKWCILDDAHDEVLNSSMVTSWDIESCLEPTDKKLFWSVLDTKGFWDTITANLETIYALKAINDNPNIDLIICTDTYYKSATAKLTRFFELFPFIEPRQVICMKEKWRLDADIVIDDKPETLEKFMLKQNPPVAIMKINKPWNETTICDYSFNEFNDGIARFCKDAAQSYVDVMKEIRLEGGNSYERCYYN